ncbi:hypothetical protein OG894_02715 [Streptomyces sp. NBC_01724]|uniref:hypothetical protein n=1 Tax=unclassified Streptomyces TaxID=2593676 RepID=UPI002DDC3159|nr:MULTISPECIES: hypothetical protein [unclassified Streptomyces]WSC73954.1 hypothetical protein OG807_38955 [Streptomyces sp. NBC_01760]WTE56331.1 hypothetical protein OG987_39990 [Streptomyces sp. NBC_01620]
MARHRRPRRTGPGATHRSRRQLAAGLVGASALAATLLTLIVDPAAPPAADRSPAAGTSDVAQQSRQ